MGETVKLHHGGPLSVEKRGERLITDPTSPESVRAFQEAIRNGAGLYTAQEDTLFDFKREFPHSYSADYFVAMCRLILSFYNSFGGIVIIGVHDELRTGGHNKKIINIEKLNTRLRELSGHPINVKHAAVPDGDVDFLVVPKRPANRAPAVLLSELGKYEEGTAWLRRGHEVLEAVSRDVSFLFSPRVSQHDVDRIPSYLPPSPSTIGRFVGRIDVLTRLFDWIAQKDEPRAFLWGRGGSGKSTIAHEFCQLIRDYGKNIGTYDRTCFERVVFLSAKQRELDAISGSISPTLSVDFRTFEELLVAKLIACDYSADEDFSPLPRDDL